MINLEQLNTNFIGEITERQVATEILKMGYLVSKPLVQSSKYDFILDANHKLYKIQVKTSSPDKENTYISFTTSISHTNTKRTINLSYSEEDVDFFATIYNNECYLVPYSICGKRSQRLRLAPTRNGQTKGILFAKDFRLEKILQNL